MDVAKAEIELMDKYNYVVVNDEVEKACTRIESIILAEHLTKERQIARFRSLIKEVL